MRKEKIYYKKLDYLRIISCIMVLFYHLNILKGGFLAVCTFFSISGYLAYMSAQKNNDFTIKSYYLNRLKKIYLPLIVIVFATVILTKLFSCNWINLKQETNSTLFGYNNQWQLNANLDYFTRNVNSPFMHLWYISILMQFELVFPIIFVVLKKLNKKVKRDISTIIVFLLAISSTLIFYLMSKSQDIMIVYYNTFARSFSILWGILLAIIHHKYNFKIARAFKNFGSTIYWLYTIVLIGFCMFVSAESKDYAIFMILATLISIRIIEYATIRFEKRAYNNKMVELLAKTSYEIYLVQYPIIFFIQNTGINEFWQVPIIIILTLISSYLIHKLLDFKIKKPIKLVTIALIIIIGGTILITTKDYSEEMKELENKLNENAQVNDAQNDQFLNTPQNEQKEENQKEKNKNTTKEEATKTEGKNSEEEKETTQKEVNEQELKEKVEAEINQMPIIGVGDSVLLGVADEMHKRFPNCYVDGKVSRTVQGGRDVLRDLKSNGKLSKTLVLALANNGDYIEKRYKDFLEEFTDKEIFWVDAAGADDPVFNERFKELAKAYPNVHVVEWEIVTKQHPEYLYADGVHVKGEGIKAYVDTVYKAIFNVYMDKYKANNR